MSRFRWAWSSLNFYKEYLFGFETLVFATSGIFSMHKQLVTRDAPIDRPVIGIGRFFALPARIGDRPVSLTSCRFRADPFIARGSGNDITATRTLTVACKHVVLHIDIHMSMVLHENDSNFNCIQCKRRLITTDNVFMSCQMRLACTAWVSVWARQHTQSNSQKFIDAYFGRKKKKDMIIWQNMI